jgi:hypothetical protein
MLYGSGVTAEEIENAAVDAERRSRDPRLVRAFFDSWTPWQQSQRREQAEATRYDALPQGAVRINEQLICPLTQESLASLEEPVYLGRGSNIRVYEYSDLVKWWLSRGTDPATTQPFSLSDLWRASV